MINLPARTLIPQSMYFIHMLNTGTAHLPLHGGYAPRWLLKRMQEMARGIALIMLDDFGRVEFLRRISDPFWFQAFGCVLGFDWHSSGVTTVVTGVLKAAIDPSETGIAVCGGKGVHSRAVPHEIAQFGEAMGLSTGTIDSMVYTSRIAAKVDNSAIQAGYHLYHHCFIMTEDAKWAIVQQGMNPANKMARRYHWLSDDTSDLVVEPHKGIVGRRERNVLNMTARDSEECRKASLDIARSDPAKLKKQVFRSADLRQTPLERWMGRNVLVMPWHINWSALESAYNFQPKNYEGLLALNGIGPSTIRGLALISDLVYGAQPCWQDPVKYSFAFGGKDGVPFPVNREDMDEAITYLDSAIKNARLGDKDKRNALKRLKDIASLAGNL